MSVACLLPLLSTIASPTPSPGSSDVADDLSLGDSREQFWVPMRAVQGHVQQTGVPHPTPQGMVCQGLGFTLDDMSGFDFL